MNWITQRRYSFHDVELSGLVRNAYQALAIDEKRRPYKPSIWKAVTKANQNVEQVWFAGVHSDVGGCYREKGLGDVAFLWMEEKAEGCGLPFDREYISSLIEPNVLGTLHNSMSLGWALLIPLVRRMGDPDYLNEDLHPAVVERYDSDSGYSPSNLSDYLQSRERKSADQEDPE